MILAQKRIDNVGNGHAKDFKTMREDEQRRRAFTSLYETTEAL